MQNVDTQPVKLEGCGIKEEVRTRQHQGELDGVTVYRSVKRG